MAGCTCASLTQLRLSCPFDDSLPGVASWASTVGGGTAGGAAPLVHHRRPPRKHDGSRRSGVGRCQPASVLGLRAVSCPCQSRSRRWRKRTSPAAQPQSGWHGERRGGAALSRERPSRVHSCHTSGRPTPSLNKKVYRYRGFAARQLGATSKSSVCWKSLLSAVAPRVIIIHCASKI